MKDIDITKIALAKDEMQKLKHIAKIEPIDARDFCSDDVLSRLYERKLIEMTHSDKFPEQRLEGLGAMPNALYLTDAGKQFLNLTRDREDREKRRFRHDWKIATFSALAGALLSKPLWSGIEFFVTLIFEK